MATSCTGEHDDVLGFVCPLGCQRNDRQNSKKADLCQDFVDSLLKDTTVPLDSASSGTDEESDETWSGSESSETSYEDSSYSSEGDSLDSAAYEFADNLESADVMEDPGKSDYPLHALTASDLFEHNAKFGKYAIWWRHSGQVYDVRRVYVLLLPWIKSRCEEMGKTAGERRKLNNSLKYSFPKYARIFHVAQMLELPINEIEKALSASKIGELRIYTFEEIQADIQTGVELTISCLRNDILPNLSDRPSILEYLQSFLRLCEGVKNERSFMSPVIAYGDPNQYSFPLPPWYEHSSIRPYLDSYVPFETSLDADYFGRERVYDILTTEECQSVFEKSIRPWLNGARPFETTVDGDVWPVLKHDLIKNDIPTKAQQKIIEQRNKRRNIFDRAHMKRRRDELLKYFIDKYYQHNSNKVDTFIQWADKMEENEKQLNALC